MFIGLYLSAQDGSTPLASSAAAAWPRAQDTVSAGSPERAGTRQGKASCAQKQSYRSDLYKQ